MSDLRDELYSLLVPLAGERLLVPRACVAEVDSLRSGKDVRLVADAGDAAAASAPAK